MTGVRKVFRMRKTIAMALILFGAALSASAGLYCEGWQSIA